MNDIICWWSGGITSAVACKLAINLFGKDQCRVIFIDTKNELEDTYRFKRDCQNWYGKAIETITGLGGDYQSIRDVWTKFKSLNVANGAICSSELKRSVRQRWEKSNDWRHQVFGFDISESRRAMSMTKNYPDTNPIYPLMLYGFTKKDCIKMVQEANITPPLAYKLGFSNNNCLKTGCVQGGIGYWQKMQRDFPDKFDEMARVEHVLSTMRGKPVTMLKDQSKNGGLIFLKPHPDFPEVKDISMKKGVEPKPLMECNGFGCAINDLLPVNSTQFELNFESIDH